MEKRLLGRQPQPLTSPLVLVQDPMDPFSGLDVLTLPPPNGETRVVLAETNLRFVPLLVS